MSKAGSLLEWHDAENGKRYAWFTLGGKTGLMIFTTRDAKMTVTAQIHMGSGVGANVHGTMEELAQAWIDLVRAEPASPGDPPPFGE